MKRKLFTFCSVLSLLLCVVAAMLWLRSHWITDAIVYIGPSGTHLAQTAGGHLLLGGENAAHPVQRLCRDSWTCPVTDWEERTLWLTRGCLRLPFTRVCAIPFCLITACLAILPSFWSASTLRQRQHRRRLGLCPSCGYDLRASLDDCPECGLLGRKLFMALSALSLLLCLGLCLLSALRLPGGRFYVPGQHRWFLQFGDDFISAVSLYRWPDRIVGAQFGTWIIAIAAGPAAWAMAGRLVRQRCKLPRKGICTSCGYDLRGNFSGICPECGESVLSQSAGKTA